MRTVLLGMSGGVDSAAAAVLLLEAGYEVAGLFIRVLPREHGKAHLEDARATCARLGIPLHVEDHTAAFKKEIIDYFTGAYAAGFTPNPCIRCNRSIKFETLREKASELGADFIATGHYARVDTGGKNGVVLRRGADKKKDQSYFLSAVPLGLLGATLMPLGWLTKEDAREAAARAGLDVSEKPESQEICFVEGNDYRAFFRNHFPEMLEPGPILDASGGKIGEHAGVVNYTIGQRRGLGISAPEPLYVSAVDPKTNTLTVGYRDACFHDLMEVSDVNWLADPGLLEGKDPPVFHAKIRSLHEPAEARLDVSDSAVRVRFSEPQWAVTPGQTAAFFHGDRVLGGGTIVSGRRSGGLPGV